MEKIIDSISGFIDSKLRNPFINTFIIAWMAFNWKPVLYFIFAKFSAGKKIWVISKYYSDICHVLIYPVLWTILVLITIPTILAGVEFVVKFITKFRLGINGEIAKKRNSVEDQILEARKVGNVNQYISELKEKINLYEKDLSSERAKNIEEFKKHNEELKQLNEKYSSEAEEQSKKINNLLVENERLKNSAYDDAYVQDRLKDSEKQKESLREEINQLRIDLDTEKAIAYLSSYFQTNEKFSRYFEFDDGSKLLLSYQHDETPIVYDVNYNEVVNLGRLVMDLQNKNATKEITLEKYNGKTVKPRDLIRFSIN
ncbi:FtsZ-binding cell division protein ZapB [Chryseobacterium ginsenosidimutans]|uniref:hypothetical protein n=1 Tax=Chryseobacterium ginsenosidimutans TaxID=687846 RepID=UPI002169C87B|nr:hypothetical protein [Chryseobacterium ginsenosidimutans]MCS3871310.1 FtsZ-binding cell division protein ZapB [Chryseobacterium ginsenosidimutans]